MVKDVRDPLWNGTEEELEKTIEKSILAHIPKNKREEVEARVRGMMENYEGREVDVICVLLYAAEQGKVNEYLEKLGKFYQEDLQFVHPEARRVSAVPGALRAESFILDCYREMGIQPRN